MKNEKLALALLWHQHQPYYRNSAGIYQMPWIRFHGTKDYLDLLLILEEFPSIRQTINLVPSLVEQLKDYTGNNARDTIWLLSEKPTNELTPDDKKNILSNFFLANVDKMIKPYGRYYNLYLKYKDQLNQETPEQQIKSFRSRDFRDLQVWYNLTWIGVESRNRPAIRKLFEKGYDFTESDKKILFREVKKILQEIIPRHKSLWESGQLEISCSPFYHPILPLLCDTFIARQSSPTLPLPEKRFMHPEDAEAQIVGALDYMERIFGHRPVGMWPSEGGVSEQALGIMARQGIEWTATDEIVLSSTLRNEYSHSRIYQPYLLDMGRNQINIFFRDHYLSDAIGFVYSNWSANRAVEDFMRRLHAVRNMLVEKYHENALHNFVVPIILDGENCWEYYEGDGKPFLRRLYAALSEDNLVETVTFKEVLTRNNEREKLKSLYPGSWINSNFNIWIGAEEDNLAWNILAHTREFLVNEEKKGLYEADVLQAAWRQIHIAEGSDWNWWYGDEHSSANDLEFDQLFREHLMQVYRLLNQDIPPILFQTIKKIHFDRFVVTHPKNFIQPEIDGKSSHFYEWVGAAVYDLGNFAQTGIHQPDRLLDKLFVGFSASHLYLRLDFSKNPAALTEFIIAIKQPRLITLVVSPLRGILEKYELREKTQQKTMLKPNFKLQNILELGIAFSDLQIAPGELLGFQLLVKQNGQLLEEFPRVNLVEITVPEKNFDLIEWSV